MFKKAPFNVMKYFQHRSARMLTENYGLIKLIILKNNFYKDNSNLLETCSKLLKALQVMGLVFLYFSW